VMFDLGKGETKSTTTDLKLLNRKLRNQYKIVANKDEFAKDVLEGVKCLVLPAPKDMFEPAEVQCLQEFMREGGSVLVLASEGKEGTTYTHLNAITMPHGIEIMNDAVVRTVYCQDYFHPKEVYIKNCCLMDSFETVAGKKEAQEDPNNKFGALLNPSLGDTDKLCCCFPFGATLNITHPARPLFTSGELSFPANRCLTAAIKVGKGRLVVCGAVEMFDDRYITKADNLSIAGGLFKWLTGETMELDSVDQDRPEYGDRVEVPDTEALAERLRCCLQESEDLHPDFTTLFDHNLFKYDTKLIPEAVALYDKLNVKHDALSLIPPQFEVPLPPRQPAVFMPCMRELPPPALDLFDLDEHFSTEKLRLAQLTNKCNDNDLEYFVREAGEILGVTDKVKIEDNNEIREPSAKRLLEFMLKRLVDYKKMELDGRGNSAGGPGFPGGLGDGGAETMQFGNDEEEADGDQDDEEAMSENEGDDQSQDEEDDF
jgi:intraflagellar transport protein 52